DQRLSATVEIVRSRLASLVGDVDEVMAHARMAMDLDPGSDQVINNLIASSYLAGELDVALELADRLASEAKSPLMRSVAAGATVSHTSLFELDPTPANE